MRTDPAVLREINERRVLNEIRKRGTITRAELQANTRLALPTILRVVDALSERGWVREIGLTHSTGGRRAQMVQLVPEAGYAVGLDFGRDLLRFVCVDLTFQTVCHKDVLPGRFRNTNDLLVVLEEFIKASGVDPARIIGVGVAAPDTNDPATGTFVDISGVSSIWRGFPVGQTIKSRFNIPAYLVNDADAAALGEWWIASADDLDSVLFVLLDAGVGAGWVVDGQMHAGTHKRFGEISQMVVSMQDPLPLSKVEPENTMNAIAAHVLMESIGRRRSVSPIETLRSCYEKACRHEAPDYQVFSHAVNSVAVGLSNLVQTLDPRRIVLGGRTISQLPGIFDWIGRQYAVLQPNSETQIQESASGDRAVLMGAAAFVFQKVFTSEFVLVQ